MLLLPDLRKPGISAVLYAGVSAIGRLHVEFNSYRSNVDYELAHNCQVCYLRGAINDMFDFDLRRLTVTEDNYEEEGVIIYHRELNKSPHLPMRESGDALRVFRRGYGASGGIDFWINIPSVLKSNINESQLRAVLNRYKLASKRYAINYI